MCLSGRTQTDGVQTWRYVFNKVFYEACLYCFFYAIHMPTALVCSNDSSKKIVRKRNRQQRQTTTATPPKPRKIIKKVTNTKTSRRKGVNTVQLNLDPKSFQNFVGPFGLKRNGIIPIPNDTPRSTMLPQLLKKPRLMQSRSYSSPRLSVNLSVDTGVASKTDSFGFVLRDLRACSVWGDMGEDS